jgi:hypothetical protein
MSCAALSRALLPVLVLPACHPGPVGPVSVVLSIDSTSYHRQGQSPVTVGFTITNAGPRPVYIPRCGGEPALLIDHWSRGNWRYLEGGFCNGAAGDPAAVAPGGTLRGITVIYRSGAYRLRMAPGPGDSSAEAGASTSFDVW